jgi:hypothetical protein
MTLPDVIRWLTSTPVNAFVMDLRWVWPISESLHFCGLALMVGTVGTFDLRLLGLGKGIPPAVLHRSVRFGVAGFVVSAITGSLFIFGQPDQYFYNDAFKVKATCLVLLGLNVLAFYTLEAREVLKLDGAGNASFRAKCFAAISLSLLVLIMLSGRMLTFFRPAGVFDPDAAAVVIDSGELLVGRVNAK